MYESSLRFELDINLNSLNREVDKTKNDEFAKKKKETEKLERVNVKTRCDLYVPGDKRLLQSLVLDAIVTDGFDKRSGSAMHKEENQK